MTSRYIRFGDRPPLVGSREFRTVNGGHVILDVDRHGRVIGIDILAEWRDEADELQHCNSQIGPCVPVYRSVTPNSAGNTPGTADGK